MSLKLAFDPEANSLLNLKEQVAELSKEDYCLVWSADLHGIKYDSLWRFV